MGKKILKINNWPHFLTFFTNQIANLDISMSVNLIPNESVHFLFMSFLMFYCCFCRRSRWGTSGITSTWAGRTTGSPTIPVAFSGSSRKSTALKVPSLTPDRLLFTAGTKQLELACCDVGFKPEESKKKIINVSTRARSNNRSQCRIKRDKLNDEKLKIALLLSISFKSI